MSNLPTKAYGISKFVVPFLLILSLLLIPFSSSAASPSATPIPTTATAPPPTSGTGTGSISGQVYNEYGETPVANALVYTKRIIGQDFQYGFDFQTRTANDGSYTLYNLPEGNYIVYATCEDGLIEYYEGKTELLDATLIQVNPGSRISNIDFTIWTPDYIGGSVSGHVYEADGKTPISEALVFIDLIESDYGSSYSTQTGNDGSYSFTKVRPGKYMLLTKKHGYIGEYFDDAIGYDQATPITVSSSKNTVADFSLKIGGTISGKVFKSDGHTPVLNAGIACFGIDNDYSADNSGDTSSDGSFVVHGLPTGHYKVLAQAEGYLMEYYEESSQETSATPVAVVELQDTPGINFTMDVGGTISGHVYKADKKTPVKNALVIANGPSRGGIATSDENGAYVIPGLRAGDFKLKCQSSDYALEYYPGTYDEDLAEPVHVDAESTNSGINFYLDPGGVISGHIFEADGITPVKDVHITAWRQESNYAAGLSDTTDSDGSYTIKPLSPGHYRIQLSKGGYLSEYYNNVTDPANATLVAVNIAQKITINITLDSGVGSISGFVYQADGVTPIQGAQISVISDNVSGKYTLSQADGSYILTGLPTASDYRVLARASGYISEYYDSSYRGGSATLITVTAPNRTGGIDFTLDKGGSISGFIYQSDGLTPIQGAEIQVIADIAAVEYAYSASDGSYIVTCLPSENYIVWVQASGYMPQYYNGCYKYASATLVTVNAPNNTEDINFSMSKGGSISGYVFQSDGKTPIQGAEVQAENVDPDMSVYSNPVHTVADGSYTIPLLPSGQQRLYVSAAGFVSEYYGGAYTRELAEPVTVVPPQCTTGIDFTLDKLFSSISGHIYKADGKTPVSNAFVSAIPVAPNQDTIRTYTDIHGRYYLGDLPDGKYRICAESVGYIREFYEDCWNSDAANQLTVDSQHGAIGIDIALDIGGMITGYVYESDGITPISGADVIATLVGVDYAFGVGVKSAVDGSFSVPGLTSGQYQVYAVKEGFTLEFYNGTYDSKKYTPVRVTAPKTTGPFTFKLDSGGAISGFIYEADGKTPVPGVSINCGRLDDDFGYGVSALSSSDGSYLISGLPPGSYRIEVSKECYFTEFYDNTLDSDQAKPVPVADKETTAGINVQLDVICSISGHIYQADGKTPVPNIKVSLLLLNNSTWIDTKTDSQGRYTAKDLHPGKYRISVSSSIADYPAIYYGNVFTPIYATLIDFTNSKNVKDADIKLDNNSLGSISGCVDPSAADTGKDWLIQVYDASTLQCVNFGHLYTTGNYKINNLPAGKYLVRVSDNGPEANYTGTIRYYIAKWYPDVFSPDQAAPVIVSAGQDTPGINFSLQTGATITGYIDAPSAGSNPQCKIDVFGAEDDNLYLTGYSVRPGNYIIGGLPDGRYKIRVSGIGLSCQWYNNASSRGEAEVIPIIDSGNVTGIDFHLTADSITPRIVSTFPAASATGVKVDSQIRVEFDKTMYAEAVPKFFNISPPVIGSLEVFDNILTLKPANPLAYKTTYTITLSAMTMDYAQNSISSLYTFTFTTEPKKSSGVSGGGGGGGGGSINPPVNQTVSLSGLSSSSTLTVNGLGYAVAPATLTCADGKLSLAISQGTSLKNANGSLLSSISAEPSTTLPVPPEGQSIIMGYTLGPEGAQFAPALVITLSCNGLALPEGVSEDDLYLAYWDGSKWSKLEATLDAATKTLTASISHFSTYALLAVLPPAATAEPSSSVPAGTPILANPETSVLVQDKSFSPGNTSAPPSGGIAEVKPSTVITLGAVPAAASPTASSEVSPSTVPVTGSIDRPAFMWLIVLIVALVLVVLPVLIIRISNSKKRR